MRKGSKKRSAIVRRSVLAGAAAVVLSAAVMIVLLIDAGDRTKSAVSEASASEAQEPISAERSRPRPPSPVPPPEHQQERPQATPQSTPQDVEPAEPLPPGGSAADLKPAAPEEPAAPEKAQPPAPEEPKAPEEPAAPEKAQPPAPEEPKAPEKAQPPAAAESEPAEKPAGVKEPAEPQVIIESPPDGSFYEPVIVVNGRIVSDSPVTEAAVNEEGARGEGRTGWYIEETGESGSFTPGDGGGFQFRFSAIGLPERINLVVWAEDREGCRGENRLSLSNDGIGPLLTIDSPRNGSYYRESVRVNGRVVNGPDDRRTSDEVRSLSCRLAAAEDAPGGDESRYIFFEEDGSFLIDVDTGRAEGPLLLEVMAEDVLGNVEETSLHLRDGTLPPRITLSSPGDGEAYSLAFYVKGRVEDPYSGDPAFGGIEAVEYTLSSLRYQEGEEPLTGRTQPDEKGEFLFRIDSSGVRGAQQLEIRARARNGNLAVRALQLKQGVAAIPGAAVTPTDGAVELQWDELPFAEEYLIRIFPGSVAESGSPHGRTVRAAAPPLRIEGLKNGVLYGFRVETEIRNRRIASETLRAIPLGEDTLSPRVTAEYQRISLEWDAVSGAERYELLRESSAAPGVWELIGADLAAPAYIDHAVRYGRRYRYAVRPAGGLGPVSTAAEASCLPAPVKKLETVASAAGFGGGTLAIVGGYAFHASREGGMSILDVSQPGLLEPVGAVPSEGANDIAVSGDYAYLSEGERGFKIFNIADPRAPYEVSRTKTAQAAALEVMGNLLYLADGRSGLKVMDVSDRLYPFELFRIGNTVARDVLSLEDTLILLTDGELTTFSLSEARRPVKLYACELVDPTEVAVEGTHAYVVERGRGMAVVDLEHPGGPCVLSRFAEPAAEGIAVHGGFAFLSTSEGGFRVLDVSDPAAPISFERIPGPKVDSLAVHGNSLLTCGAGGLRRITMYLFGRSYEIASVSLNANARGLKVEDDAVYVAQGGEGLATVEIGRSAVPEMTGRISAIPGYSEDVERWGDVVLVAAGEEGIKGYRELGDGAEPVFRIKPEGFVRTVHVENGLLSAVIDGEGIELYPLPVPSASRGGADGEFFGPKLGAFVRSGDPRAAAWAGGSMYVADYREGIKRIDLSVLNEPRVTAPFGRQRTVALSAIGELLFAGGFDGVEVYDVSNPEAIELLCCIGLPFVESLTTDGTYLYVAQGVHGVKVIDPVTVRGPRIVSECPNLYAVDIAVRDGFAYVSSGNEVKVLDIIIPPWLQSR